MCALKLKNIPVAGPSITEKEIAYVTDAISNGWYEGANYYIDQFEKKFAEYLGRKFSISLPSCTSALHLSLLAAGVGAGDEVIVPDVTWIASAAPISYVGATPVFADIDPRTWCLSVESIADCLTSKTKAVIVVNLYGHLPEWDALLQFCKKHQLTVIEDAAQSIGSRYKNKLSGTFGDTSCFSFHGSKTLVTGEGGMLVTDDKNIYEQCLILRDHGRLPGDTLFQNVQVGYKYKMSALQAALGLAQLERIDELVNKKRQIFNYYADIFRESTELTLNPHHPDVYNSYWMTTAVFGEHLVLHKHNVIKKLKQRGIASRPFFDPLSSLQAYQHFPNIRNAINQNVNSYRIANRGINLPSALILDNTQIDAVKSAISEIVSEKEFSI